MNSIMMYVKMLFKPDLREACRIAYGDDFVRQYDDLQHGMPIGNLVDTIEFIDKLETVRKRLRA